MTNAPRVTDHLCADCRAHYDEVKRLLAAAGVAFAEDARLVRGLDYYVRTAFEATAGNLGAQNAVGGGGRYDGLVEALGGPPLAGVGFAFGVERLLLAAQQQSAEVRPYACVIPLSDAATAPALQLAHRLRSAGVRAELESAGRSVKSAMRRADKLGAHFAILLGDDELAAGRATVRDMTAQRDHRLALALDAAGEMAALTLTSLATGAPAGANGAAGGGGDGG